MENYKIWQKAGHTYTLSHVGEKSGILWEKNSEQSKKRIKTNSFVAPINHLIRTAWYCGQYFTSLLSANGTAHIFQSIAISGFATNTYLSNKIFLLYLSLPVQG